MEKVIMINNNNNKNNGLISDLPDELVLGSILSLLTFNDVAQTSLVSRGWKRYWHQCTVLDFKNKLSTWFFPFKVHSSIVPVERSKFVNWVDNVLQKHIGSFIDQLKINFDLNKYYRSHIDKWVVWAFEKHVKIFVLNLLCGSSSDPRDYENKGTPHYNLEQTLVENCFKVNKPLLTSLCLKGVNVTTQVVELILVTCNSTLENFSIENSHFLISITTSLPSLKHLEVFHCLYMTTIDIDAPKLLSFTYYGAALRKLHIANASSLSQLTFVGKRNYPVAFAYNSLSNYFPQLEYLHLGFFIQSNVNFSFDICSVLVNLKHLNLSVDGSHDQSLSGWIPLLEACPLVEKLTLKVISSWKGPKPYKKQVMSDKHPLQCLKTLEIIGFVGSYIDLDLVNFVFANATALQEVTVEPKARPLDEAQRQEMEDLRLKVPTGVKIVFIPARRLLYM